MPPRPGQPDRPGRIDADATHHTLAAEHLTLAYDEIEVAATSAWPSPPGEITVLVGAERVRQVDAAAGAGPPAQADARRRCCSTARASTACRREEVATRLGILPQSPIAPEGITVADLVARGRYPHQSWFRQWTAADERVIDRGDASPPAPSTSPAPVDELSGGQRQRVWIAMALAQGTDLMLLDEPTTFLDLAHQVEVLDLLVDLNQRERRTIVLVLHDLNQAARYSHHLIAMQRRPARRRGRAGGGGHRSPRAARCSGSSAG